MTPERCFQISRLFLFNSGRANPTLNTGQSGSSIIYSHMTIVQWFFFLLIVFTKDSPKLRSKVERKTIYLNF